MGAYAVYSDKPFKSNGKLIRKRKRNSFLDKNMELVKNAGFIIDEKEQKVIVVKDSEKCI